MSVVFNFNASLIDVVPVSLTSFPVDMKRLKKSELLMSFVCLSFFFTYHTEFSECCV